MHSRCIGIKTDMAARFYWRKYRSDAQNISLSLSLASNFYCVKCVKHVKNYPKTFLKYILSNIRFPIMSEAIIHFQITVISKWSSMWSLCFSPLLLLLQTLNSLVIWHYSNFQWVMSSNGCILCYGFFGCQLFLNEVLWRA